METDLFVCTWWEHLCEWEAEKGEGCREAFRKAVPYSNIHLAMGVWGILILIYCVNALLEFANMGERARHTFNNSLSKYFLGPFYVLNISPDSGNTGVNDTSCYLTIKAAFPLLIVIRSSHVGGSPWGFCGNKLAVKLDLVLARSGSTLLDNIRKRMWTW